MNPIKKSSKTNPSKKDAVVVEFSAYKSKISRSDNSKDVRQSRLLTNDSKKKIAQSLLSLQKLEDLKKKLQNILPPTFPK